jgi:hypothetical protein
MCHAVCCFSELAYACQKLSWRSSRQRDVRLASATAQSSGWNATNSVSRTRHDRPSLGSARRQNPKLAYLREVDWRLWMIDRALGQRCGDLCLTLRPVPQPHPQPLANARCVCTHTLSRCLARQDRATTTGMIKSAMRNNMHCSRLGISICAAFPSFTEAATTTQATPEYGALAGLKNEPPLGKA